MGEERDNMKVAAYVILGLDAFLFLLWFVGIIIIFALDCRALLFVTHILLLLHFGTQSVALVSILDEWHLRDEDDKHFVRSPEGVADRKRRGNVRYSPLMWLIASLVSFFGDVYLLGNDVLNYVQTPEGNCRKYIIFELFLEVVATLVTILSAIWFIAIVIDKRRRRHEREERERKAGLSTAARPVLCSGWSRVSHYGLK